MRLGISVMGTPHTQIPPIYIQPVNHHHLLQSPSHRTHYLQWRILNTISFQWVQCPEVVLAHPMNLDSEQILSLNLRNQSFHTPFAQVQVLTQRLGREDIRTESEWSGVDIREQSIQNVGVHSVGCNIWWDSVHSRTIICRVLWRFREVLFCDLTPAEQDRSTQRYCNLHFLREAGESFASFLRDQVVEFGSWLMTMEILGCPPSVCRRKSCKIYTIHCERCVW